ncbi:UNKNOWN [Stylonychia lemnae]|uniref:Uncharacterized protein n=1 Tax=Stylonychia lemnae TaxID=5949 RepID=A0A078AWH7_STYLE|nr:UNKNOWN [Stylonychia lemnae]|eukprot:CDW86815.1 UNKNOWN [Stylonychia lemnae]
MEVVSNQTQINQESNVFDKILMKIYYQDYQAACEGQLNLTTKQVPKDIEIIQNRKVQWMNYENQDVINLDYSEFLIAATSKDQQLDQKPCLFTKISINNQSQVLSLIGLQQAIENEDEAVLLLIPEDSGQCKTFINEFYTVQNIFKIFNYYNQMNEPPQEDSQLDEQDLEFLEQQIEFIDNTMECDDDERFQDAVDDYFNMSDQSNQHQIKSPLEFFYVSKTINEFKLLKSDVKRISPIYEDQAQKYIGLYHKDKTTSILKIEESNNSNQGFELRYPENHQINFSGKLINYNPEEKLIFYRDDALLHAVNLETKRSVNFHVQPSFGIYLPIMKSTLFIGKDKDINVFIHESNNLVPPSTLMRILMQYSYISECTSFTDESNALYFALSCTHSLTKMTHILYITLIENQPSQNAPKYQFKLLDLIKFKPGHQINKLLLLENGEQLMILYNNSKIKKISLNINGEDMKAYRRLEFRAKHSLNLYQPKTLVLLQNKKDVLIQEKRGGVCIIKMTRDKQSPSQHNIYFDMSYTNSKYVVAFKNQMLMFAIDKLDNSKILVQGLFKVKQEQLVQSLIDDKQQIQLAQTILRSQGGNNMSLILYKLEKSNFQDEVLIDQYLNQEFKDSKSLMSILLEQNIPNVKIVQKIIDKAIQIFAKNTSDTDTIGLILRAKKRLDLLQESRLELSSKLNLRSYLFIDTIGSIISYFPFQFTDSSYILKLVLKSLEEEIILNYHQVIQNLPLEIIDPHFLLGYLPPGSSQFSKFWLNFQKLLNDKNIEQFSNLMYDYQIYHTIAVEYIFQLNQPGKALRILQEASQNRMIKNLTKLSIQAVESTLIKNPENLMDQEKKIADLFGFEVSLNESVKAIERDEDLVQVTLDIIYDKLSVKNQEQIYMYIQRLQTLIQTENQANFIRSYLNNHYDIARNILHNYAIDTPFKDLLKIQVNSSTGGYLDEFKNLCSQIMNHQISQSKGVKEQVLAFGRSKTIGQIDQKWIDLLHSLVRLRDQLGLSEEQADIYQIFLSKLLDNRVTSSIEQLIKSGLIPMEDLQTSILKYLQEQFNKSSDDNFYQNFQNSKAFLEILIEKDESGKNIENLYKENRLLDASLFLKQNNLLFGQIPNAQIRQDISNDRLIDKILQVHGFSQYPSFFSVLLEAQQLIDETKQNQVVVKVFKYFNSLRYFENLNQIPSYMEQMIYELILLRKVENAEQMRWVDELEVILVKLVKLFEGIDKWQIKKDMIKFLHKYMNKSSSLYYDICQISLRIMKEQRQTDLVQNIVMSIQNNMQSRLRYYMRQFKQISENLNNDDQVLKYLIETKQFECYHIKELARVLEISEDLKAKLKYLKNKSLDQILSALQNLDFDYSQEASNQSITQVNQSQINENNQEKNLSSGLKNEQVVQQEIVEEENPLKDIIKNIEDMEQVAMIIDMNYNNWNDKFDIQKLILDMTRLSIKTLPENLLRLIIKRILEESKLNFDIEAIVKSFNDFSNFLNFFLPLKAISESIDSNTLPDQFAIAQLKYQQLEDQQSISLIDELKQLVTDYNVFIVCQSYDVFEKYSDQLQKLTLTALYTNKLDIYLHSYNFIKNLSDQDVSKIFYKVLDKELMKELIEDQYLINEINRKYIDKFNDQYPDDIDINLREFMIQ